MANPEFSAQTAERMTGDEACNWFQGRAAEFREKGATWMRATVDPEHDPEIRLLEGWVERPAIEPSPHFHMIAMQ